MAEDPDSPLEYRWIVTFARSLPRPTRMFMVAAAISQMGNTGLILATATISADAAPTAPQAATYTAVMFFLFFAWSALATPFTGRLTSWLGALPAFLMIQVASFAVWAAIALLIGLGIPGYPLLLISSVVFGALAGWNMPLNQVALSSYAPTADRARSIAVMGAAQGVGSVVGGPLAGLIVDWVGPIWVLAFNAVSSLPLAWLIVAVSPVQTPQAPSRAGGSLRAVWNAVHSKTAIRSAVVVATTSALLIGPMTHMVVPFARDLNHELALHAGLLLGALAAGHMVSPVLLPRLRHANHGVASVRAYVMAACAMVLVAVVATVLDGSSELIMLMMILIVFAAGSMTGRAYLINFGQTESDEEKRTSHLAAYFLAVTVGVMVGSLIWGQLFATVGSAWSMVIFGVGTLLTMIFYWRALLRGDRSPGSQSVGSQ